MRIAFVQLGSWGDCINSTMMFKPLRNHFKDCVIDVHTTTLYRSAFENNPLIDGLIAHDADTKSRAFDLYNVVPQRLSGYDKVLVPAPILHPDWRTSKKHPELGNNLWCTFMRALEELGVEYEYPVETVLKLTDAEVQKAREFVNKHREPDGGRLILMETHGESGQTFWDDNWALRVGSALLHNPKNRLLISRKGMTNSIGRLVKQGAVFVGELSLRECAEVFNHCHMFISVSSGLCNACNTNWCRPEIPWIEVVNNTSVASFTIRRSSTTRSYWYDNNLASFVTWLQPWC